MQAQTLPPPSLFGFQGASLERTRKPIEREESSDIVGVFNGEGPPVPIPNTEVKLTSAENTCLATDREDRSMPTQKRTAERQFFFCAWAWCSLNTMLLLYTRGALLPPFPLVKDTDLCFNRFCLRNGR